MDSEWDGQATLENLEGVRAFVESACLRAGADARACFDLKLAVDEACSNIVVHGYQGVSPGRIRVTLTADAGRLTVVVTDWGRAFDPSAIRPPDVGAALEERSSGGLGWHLIRSVVDEVSYVADGVRGNRLTLVKRTEAGEE